MTTAITLSPGDIVYNSWGYDQTNIDFYEVTKVTAKFATLEAIGQTVVKYHESGSTEVVPEPSQILTGHWQTDQNGRHGYRIREDDVYINFKHGGGCKYDGKPKYVSLCSAYAWRNRTQNPDGTFEVDKPFTVPMNSLYK